MNKTAMRGSWRWVRGEVKSEWAKLTANDRLRIEGELDKLIGLFQQRYGNTREHAIQSLMHYLDEYHTRTSEFVTEAIEHMPVKVERKRVLPVLAVASAVGAALFIRSMMKESEPRILHPA